MTQNESYKYINHGFRPRGIEWKWLEIQKYQIRTNSRDLTGRAITNFDNNIFLRTHIFLTPRLYQNYCLFVT